MTAATLQQAARRLVTQKAGFEGVKPAPAKGARPGERTTGRPASAANAAALSLVESDASLREYFSPVTVLSSDGLFAIQVSRIKIVQLEGNGRMEFKNPP